MTEVDPDSWSGFVIRMKQRHLVVFNSVQSPPRINSVVMHELAHIALGHELSSVGVTSEGHLIPTVYSQDQEDEANWLAGTLLLPRAALLEIRSCGLNDSEAMRQFSVSEDMLRWRFRMTGVDYQLENARRRRSN
ncbi:MAG: ImmA/IrrE family metallo-endopeptidase [Alphaproteobacteria bacterium]|nr:ImmA/IrrE family metallo-endopeptidase [Alphaproteobacteria bacterium]MBU0804148.1 ImmA/IrrE family metallo-endopeptidase [Alphaproteobacteria bacterium]MBU0870979.1 ImmA/IrrE family metallo-endopeptidase [Alphaproteobacteria bacterium]MBU1400734.1 ImmA/IrrE family metallo-endopeptidase [Alphaproteobacteria bacterium]MBU1592849.1 ImmA/IrrE family metallo-endopeptidase [Alphaproteobacteria bacterium]